MVVGRVYFLELEDSVGTLIIKMYAAAIHSGKIPCYPRKMLSQHFHVFHFSVDTFVETGEGKLD